MSSTRLAFRALGSTTCLVLGLALTGCGSSDSGQTGQSLTKAQARSALLTQANLGSGYKVDTSDDNSDAPGCLKNLDSRTDAPVEAERDFASTNGVGLPTVGSQVSSYSSEGAARAAMASARKAIDRCTSVEDTDEDGTKTSLTIEHNSESSVRGGDEQLNIIATGKVVADGNDVPIALALSAVRVHGEVVVVTYGDLAAEVSGDLDAYLAAAVGRVAAVRAHAKPDNSEVAVSGSGSGFDEGGADGSDEASDAPAATLPLDGGSYTWKSGITMKLQVVRVEPWGTRDDFCGDGSCGIANKDDTRFVVKYTVSVPADFDGPFDPSSCPGELHSKTGNDDEALSGVAGDYEKDLGGKIFPGLSKFGTDEYYIEKAYAGQEFYIESDCGDTDYSGESAYFVGPIKKVA